MRRLSSPATTGSHGLTGCGSPFFAFCGGAIARRPERVKPEHATKEGAQGADPSVSSARKSAASAGERSEPKRWRALTLDLQEKIYAVTTCGGECFIPLRGGLEKSVDR